MFQRSNISVQNIQVLFVQKNKGMWGDEFLIGDSGGSDRFFCGQLDISQSDGNMHMRGKYKTSALSIS